MKFTLVAVGENITAYPYLFKLSTILKEEGDLEYIYWSRTTDKHDTLDDIEYNMILAVCPNNKASLLIAYFVWIFKLFTVFLKRPPSERIYFVSRLDAAIAMWSLRFLGKKFKYIYLDRDAYHMTYQLGFFKPFVRWFEASIAKQALYHFIPGKSRDFTKAKNVLTIENTPNRKIFEEAKELGKSLKKDIRFTIYINGWLVKTRGASAILQAIKTLDPKKFKVLVAGPVQCKPISDLIDLDVVEYLGQLSNTASLSYYFISDLVLSFYDPTIEINRKAEPNKWYDCVFCGVPFLTNSGIETSEPFEKIGLAKTINYNSEEDLIKLLETSQHNREVSNIDPAVLINTLGVDYWDEKVRNVIRNLKAKVV